MSYTTVRVSERTAEALAELKHRGDNYDDVVRRLFRDARGETVDDVAPGGATGDQAEAEAESEAE